MSNSPIAIAGLTAPAQPPSVSTPVVPATSYSPAKAAEERDKRLASVKTIVETRKTGRRLVRPRLVKNEEPQSDVDMTEAEGPSSGGKFVHSQDTETTTLTPLIRKRLATSSTSDLQEETQMQGDTSSDVAAPVQKRSRGSDSPQEAAEGQTAGLENLETLSSIEEPFDATADLPQGSTDEAIDVEKEEAEISEGQAEDSKEPSLVDGTSEVELQNEKATVVDEVLDKPSEKRMAFDDGAKDQVEQGIPPTMIELGTEKEEGELDPDVTDNEGGGDMSNITGGTEIGEGQLETVAAPMSSPARGDEEGLVGAAVDMGDINSPEAVKDDKDPEGDVVEEIVEDSDKSNDGNEQMATETDQTTEAALVSESASTSVSAAVDAGVSKQGSPSPPTPADTEVKQAGGSSTTINLSQRAKERSVIRQSGNVSPAAPVIARGRGRPVTRGRGARGGRGRAGRGHSSNDQS